MSAEPPRAGADPAVSIKLPTYNRAALLGRSVRSVLGRWWVPDAAVEHWIPKERQSVVYLRSYFKLQGRTFHKWDTDGRPTYWGRPLWLWRSIIRVELAYSRARLSGDPKRWIKPLIQASLLRGSTRRN